MCPFARQEARTHDAHRPPRSVASLRSPPRRWSALEVAPHAPEVSLLKELLAAQRETNELLKKQLKS